MAKPKQNNKTNSNKKNMKNMVKPNYKLISLVIGLMAISFLTIFYAFAWQEPAQSPPAGNVPAPLNVGPEGQAKEGGLILNTGGADIGLIVDKGNVGIGTVTPADKLHVIGNLRLQDGEVRVGEIRLSPFRLDMGTKKIENLAAPTASSDVATKTYVDALAHGGGCYIAWHTSSCAVDYTPQS